MGLDSLNEPLMPDLCQVLETRVKTEARHQGGELDEKGWALLGRGPQLSMKHFGRKEEPPLHSSSTHIRQSIPVLALLPPWLPLK